MRDLIIFLMYNLFAVVILPGVLASIVLDAKRHIEIMNEYG